MCLIRFQLFNKIGQIIIFRTIELILFDDILQHNDVLLLEKEKLNCETNEV